MALDQHQNCDKNIDIEDEPTSIMPTHGSFPASDIDNTNAQLETVVKQLETHSSLMMS